MNLMKQLTDRVAVITGAGSGIGRATALALAKEGCELALSDVNESGLLETVALIGGDSTKVTTYLVDAASPTEMKKFADAVASAHGHVHIVINNAGVALAGNIEENSLEDLEWMVGINFWGVVYGCKFFLPYIRKEEEGHIINISSLAGLMAIPSLGGYSATKAAVRSWTETLSNELRDTPIKVSSIHPGGIATSIVDQARVAESLNQEEMATNFSQRGVSPDRVAQKIVSVLKSGKLRGLICTETYVLAALLRVMPRTTHRLLGWGWQRAQSQVTRR